MNAFQSAEPDCLVYCLAGIQPMYLTMLRAALICPDGQKDRELAVALPHVPDLVVVRTFTTYPSPEELLRTIRVRKVDLLILSVDDFVQAETLAKHIDNLMPGFAVISLGQGEAVEVLRELMHLGIREHLTSPIQEVTLVAAVEAVRQRLLSHRVSIPNQADLYTFLPAKPGVGASTITVSTSCALAEDLGVRTLLIDGDLAGGTVQFLLKLGPTASVIDAMTHAEAGNLDEGLWLQVIGNFDKLEVLHAGDLDTPPGMEVPGLAQVLSMARAQYEVICVDLGGQFDPFSIALLRDSRRIFLVSTPEVVPLHLARVRMDRLTQLGLRDKVSLLLNRKVRDEVTSSEVEKAVGIPVSYSFSNDYRAVQGAILKASSVPQSSELGESILKLARSLAPQGEAKPTTHHHKFLQFFHIPRIQDPDTVWQG